jgi:hypothetical protein
MYLQKVKSKITLFLLASFKPLNEEHDPDPYSNLADPEHRVLGNPQPLRLRLNNSSVGDPDPHIFGPPGSGSISKIYGSGFFPFLIDC